MGGRRPGRIACVLAGVFATIAVLSGVSQAQLELYDNFSAPQINPDRWRGFESQSGNCCPDAEANRFIDRGKLHIALTSYGDVTSNSGTRTGRFGLSFSNPTPITAMEASVSVKQASFQDCTGNTSTSRAGAQLIGAFFNDGASSGADDRTGDILASIRKQQTHNGNQITADIQRCNDSGCSSSSTLTSFAFTTTWTQNQSHVLRLEVDPAGNGFRYTVNPGKTTEETTVLTFTAADSLPPVQNFKNVRAINTAANCTTGRTKVVMDALFDNVKLNPEAVP